MEEVYKEINSLDDIIQETIIGSPQPNPGGGSGGTFTNSQKAIQDSVTLLKHRIAYFMQDNLSTLLKRDEYLRPKDV